MFDNLIDASTMDLIVGFMVFIAIAPNVLELIQELCRNK